MNILIADDHALFRDTLEHYISRAQPDYKLFLASDFREVSELLKSGKFIPDLCVLDFKMPGMKGYEGFQYLLSAYPEYSFAVMSGVAEPEDIKKILSLGVRGFLPKTLPGRVILKAIDTMLTGKNFIPYTQDAAILAPSYLKEKILAHNDDCNGMETIHLTRREKDVLRFLCQGKSNREIGEALGLKIVTVKLHVRGIFRKLECDNRTRAVLKARQLGLLN